MIEILSDFFLMGGYAFYVWTSYAITFAVLALNWWAPMRRRRRISRSLAHGARLSRIGAAPEACDLRRANEVDPPDDISTPGASPS